MVPALVKHVRPRLLIRVSRGDFSEKLYKLTAYIHFEIPFDTTTVRREKNISTARF